MAERRRAFQIRAHAAFFLRITIGGRKMNDTQLKAVSHAAAVILGTALGYFVPGVPWGLIFSAFGMN